MAAKSPRRLGAGRYLGSGGLLFEQTRRPGLSMNLSVVSHLLGTAGGCLQKTKRENMAFCSNPKGAATLQSSDITTVDMGSLSTLSSKKKGHMLDIVGRQLEPVA
ncbi:unnamed protein product [Fusarium venenatum]|uniref:Uncharacterized protein n=1 Tax=Fusarium venenatum TaxID=56646 RepID=A0A2L2TGJ2_9HYPO|nr:uncharacterized protein FVRRES_10159 [Fusarium venenatum]CEI70082.1 unnamed protein product [Fusarium venenatum]